MSVLSAYDLSMSFIERKLFDSITFTVEEKDKIGFIGANGSGKTTLFKILTGQLSPDTGTVTVSKNTTVGYMEQHACTSLNRTVYEELLSVFQPLIDMENYLRELEHKISEEGSKTNSPILEKLMDDYSHTLETFASKNGYGYKSEAKGILKGLDNETIMDITELSIEEIELIRKEMSLN